MKTFKVPFGLSTDQSLIAAESAIKGIIYFCPSCGEQLTFRSGEFKAKHFAHRADTTCSSETVLHAIAKRRIQQVVLDWLAGGAAPVLVRKCLWGPLLENYECQNTVLQPLPRERVTEVVLEQALPDLRKPDVLLLLNGTPVLAIEVLVTHKVDAKKAHDLGALSWIELDAAAVLETPHTWSPLQMNLTGRSACASCRLLQMKNMEVARLALRRFQLPWPTGYAVGVAECYHCHSDIPIYEWINWDLLDAFEEPSSTGEHFDLWLDRKYPPPEPRPLTVQFRYSKALGERHWVNVCPACKWIQGNYSVRPDWVCWRDI